MIGVGAAVFGLGLVAATAVLYPAPAVEDWGGTTRIVAVSMTAGISALFLASLPVYLLAGFTAPGVSSGR